MSDDFEEIRFTTNFDTNCGYFWLIALGITFIVGAITWLVNNEISCQNIAQFSKQSFIKNLVVSPVEVDPLNEGTTKRVKIESFI